MKRLLSSAALILLLSSAASGADRRNVIVVLFDDLNHHASVLAESLGTEHPAPTPHLDRFAERAMLFTRASCPAPICNPSRVAFLTGRRPSTTGIYANDQPWREHLKDARTLPEKFSEAGWFTAGAGKIYHHFAKAEGFQDFESWKLFRQRPGDPKPAKKPLNGLHRTGGFDWGPLEVSRAKMSDRRLVDQVCSSLDRLEQPFFLCVGIFHPHDPWYVPREVLEEFALDEIVPPDGPADDLDDVSKVAREWVGKTDRHQQILATGQRKEAVRGYYAATRLADEALGRLLERLESTGRLADTYVVIASDHGFHLGEKQHWGKGTLWRASTHVPLLIAGPGIDGGARCDQPVNLVDLYPTLLDLCELPGDEDLDGHSLAPLLEDPASDWPHASITTHGKGNHAVRTQDWSLLSYEDGSTELYDLRTDPGERENLAADPTKAAVIADLRSHLPGTDAEPAPAVDRRGLRKEQRKAERDKERKKDKEGGDGGGDGQSP